MGNGWMFVEQLLWLYLHSQIGSYARISKAVSVRS